MEKPLKDYHRAFYRRVTERKWGEIEEELRTYNARSQECLLLNQSHFSDSSDPPDPGEVYSDPSCFTILCSSPSVPLDVVKQVIKTVGEEYLQKSEDGYENTPLHYICRCNSSEISTVEYIAETFGEVLLKLKNKKCLTPIHFAFLYQTNAEVPKMLSCQLWLWKSAFIISNDKRNSVLHEFFLMGNSNNEILELLLEVCNLPKFQNKDGDTFLHVALRSSTPTEFLLELLKENKSSLDKVVNLKNECGNTVLHEAISISNVDSRVLKVLLDFGENCKLLAQQNRKGQTPLHLLFLSKNDTTSEIALLLHHCTQDIMLKQDKQGDTALHIALRQDLIKIDQLKLLVNLGGSELILCRNMRNKTPLDEAVVQKEKSESWNF